MSLSVFASQQGERASISHIAHLQCSVSTLPSSPSSTAASKDVETFDECGEVDFEGKGGLTTEDKLLEEAGLDVGVCLDTLGLLHDHLQTVAAQKTCTHLLQR